jgi:prepilin-type N-terminal cleavage/methylation domain-containing protein/prepilin-type processing-associated H-X9-DG protein
MRTRFAQTALRGNRDDQLQSPAFTLIEVLVVVSIIALLIAILLPSLRNAREQTRLVVCNTQLRELMTSALMYASEHKGRLPGAAINDNPFRLEYDAGTRKDWLSWSGTWQVMIGYSTRETSKAWANAPHGGRLFRYYKKPELLKCPSAEKFNDKLSYSTPENVSMALKDRSGERRGLPPVLDMVKHPAFAIQFLDEDEAHSMSTISVDDGFGGPDQFADRHLGKATVAFFDGHGEAFYFPKGKNSRYVQNRSKEPFTAWLIQIAPFNSRYTPRPWTWDGDYKNWPKFKPPDQVNFPDFPCREPGPGCE